MTEKVTPMMRQYRRIKSELAPEVILFYRLGDFYEMFFEDAQVAAPILDILDDVFEPDVLRRMLPGPEESGSYADPCAEPAGFKSILGLALLRHELGLA